ncbi:hypothetical protein Q9L58_002281 [Maublancomyces gigas]|uniref:Uncharacterized protein n=1 Tax=Discina gigas TaxID=1032678 RepID=A0ABR3GS74_9PEZI
MANILTIPNELLDEIASYLEPLATSHLLITCRSLSSRLAPAMLRHAIAPKHGIHALHWASQMRHLSLVKTLLPLFPVDLRDQGGITALYYAAVAADATDETAESIVRLLITHGADPNSESHSVPLCPAIYARSSNIVRLLLDAGANPDWRGGGDEPLVVKAARAGDVAGILNLLLEHGADINGCNGHGSTPLLIAAQYGYFNMVKMLVEKGAKLDCVDGDGDTPLILATGQQRQIVAEYLVGQEGIDKLSANHAGDTPAILARAARYDNVLRVLGERGSVGDSEAVKSGRRCALSCGIGSRRLSELFCWRVRSKQG